MLLGALGFVARYADQLPYGDDWTTVGVLAGKQPLTLSWLWEPYYGYREFALRAFLVASGVLSDFDLRVPRFANVLVMALGAALLIRSSRILRGRASWTDAFFPLAVLHWGHVGPLLQNQYLIYALSATLLYSLVYLVARAPSPLEWRHVALASIALVVLVLCGATGVAMGAPLALWLASAAWESQRESGASASRRAAVLLLAAAPPVLMGLYFVGFRIPPDAASAPGTAGVLILAGRFLSTAIGSAGRSGWPFSGLAIVMLIAASLWAVLRRAGTSRSAWIALTGATVAVAVGVGLGRSGHAADRIYIGFLDRYVTIAVPALCIAYLGWSLASSRAARWVQAGFFVLMLALLPVNARTGLGTANTRRDMARAFRKDLESGMAVKELAARHWPYFHRGERQFLRMLEISSKGRIGPFRAGTRERANP